MSLAQVLEELPSLGVAERQLLIRRALEMDDSDFAPADEAIIAARLEDHRRDPASTVPFDEMKNALRSRFAK